MLGPSKAIQVRRAMTIRPTSSSYTLNTTAKENI